MTWFKRIFAHPFYKLLGLSLALAIWLHVQSGAVVEGRFRLLIDWRLPVDLVTAEPLPGSVTVILSGTRAAIRRAERANLALGIDLTDAAQGETALELASFTVSGLPTNVSVVGYAPSALKVVLDEPSSKKVRVVGQSVGEPADGYRVAALVIEPDVVSIKGPRSRVSEVVEVRTKPVDLSGLTADAVVDVELDLPRSIELDGPVFPRARVDLEAAVHRRTFSSVPVVLARAAPYEPARTEVVVQLEGPADALRDVPPDAVVVLAHLPDNPNRATYEVGFGPTSGVRLTVVHPHGDRVRVAGVEPGILELKRR
jgi:hypothetical protein